MLKTKIDEKCTQNKLVCKVTCSIYTPESSFHTYFTPRSWVCIYCQSEEEAYVKAHENMADDEILKDKDVKCF